MIIGEAMKTKIKEMYEGGDAISKISQSLGISPENVKKVLTELSVPIRPSGKKPVEDAVKTPAVESTTSEVPSVPTEEGKPKVEPAKKPAVKKVGVKKVSSKKVKPNQKVKKSGFHLKPTVLKKIKKKIGFFKRLAIYLEALGKIKF